MQVIKIFFCYCSIKKRFHISLNAKKWVFENFFFLLAKSSTLAELIEMHAQPFGSGKLESRIVSMVELESEAVSALISYLNDFPLKEYGITMISCSTAISLIEIGRKYKIHNLEKYICELIIEERDASWFDIKSLVKLFQFSNDLEYKEKLKFKVMQTFQMYENINVKASYSYAFTVNEYLFLN